MANRITIRDCTGCRWLMRSAWMAQEMLTTFDGEIEALTLQPASGGLFVVTANEKLVWSRKQAARFLEITGLKQAVRDEISPDKPLEHCDVKKDQ